MNADKKQLFAFSYGRTRFFETRQKTHFAGNGAKMTRMRKWRRHTVECKRQAVERMKVSENVTALARELGIQQKLLYTWKYQLEGRPEPRHANLGITAEDRLSAPRAPFFSRKGDCAISLISRKLLTS